MTLLRRCGHPNNKFCLNQLHASTAQSPEDTAVSKVPVCLHLTIESVKEESQRCRENQDAIKIRSSSSFKKQLVVNHINLESILLTRNSEN